MIEQISTPVKFVAFYTASKTGKTGLTVTIDIYDPSGSQIVTGGSATAIGGGLYSYTLSTNNSAEGEYAAIFKTTDATVDSQHIPSLWVLGRAGVENLDATVSSRLAPSGTLATVTTLTNAPTVPTASAIASQVRTELSVELGRVDQNISSRLATSGYTAPSAAPTVTDIRQEMDSNSTKLANLDATVSSRLAGSAYSAAPTTAQIATAVEGSLLNEADGQAVLNAIVGAIGNTNVSEVSLVAAVRADLERVGGKIDNIPTTSAPTAAANASAVRSELTVELAKVAALNTDRLANVATTAIVGNLIAQANS